jgi:putative nucleotidyltransferase with HDIG domain
MLVVLVGAIAVGVAVADLGDWDPALLGILLVLVVGADLMEVQWKRISVSGSFLGLTLAMGLLGPAQAALLGLVGTAVWTLQPPRPRTPAALLNLANFAAFPLVGGLAMLGLSDVTDIDRTELTYACVLVPGFALAHLVNSGFTLVGHKVLDGASMRARLRSLYIPLLPSDAAMVILASLIVYAEVQLGAVALGMLVALFFLYLYLYRELLVSQERAELLQKRGEELASLQVGVLVAMLRTLSMRDRMTARHSAAVARYAREIASAAGCSAAEQDLVHTAGLLHDIGKFIFPDRILLASTKLNDEDWEIVKRHPYQGAKVVREVEGYGPVADIILCHHERIDGKGYPRGVAGDDIPILSRCISIADTYDVMTSRDSYRDPVSSEDAIAELRRVSGKQLDGGLVELFIGLLESKGVAFRHGDDADFEAELAFEKRVRDYAAPREDSEPVPAAA